MSDGVPPDVWDVTTDLMLPVEQLWYGQVPGRLLLAALPLGNPPGVSFVGLVRAELAEIAVLPVDAAAGLPGRFVKPVAGDRTARHAAPPPEKW